MPARVVIDALKAVPWVDCGRGRGRFGKLVIVSCRSYSCDITACQACRREHRADYMLTDAVWRVVAGEFADGLLCLPCAGALLGRPFRADDFTVTPINQTIRFLLGQKS